MNNLQVVKILAYGTYKRFMYVKFNDTVQCVKITDSLYDYLKSIGVPTCQSFRQRK